MPDSQKHGMPIITVVTLIFVICILPVTFTPSGSWAGTLFTCVISTALFAFLYMTTQYKWIFLIPVIPYFTAFVVTKNPLMAMEAVTFYPAGIAIIFAVKKKFTRTTAIITASSAVASYYIVYIIISIIAVYGTINAEILESFRDEAIKPFREVYSQMTTMSNGIEIPLYSENEINYIITTILRFIPAAVICVTNITAYISVLIYKSLARIFDRTHVIPYEDWQLKMSIISAYIYSATYLIVTFGGSVTGIITSVTANILIILTPGFSYIGLKDLIRKFKSGKGKRFVAAVIVLSVIFLLVNPSMIFYILSLLGVIETFVDYYTVKRSIE